MKSANAPALLQEAAAEAEFKGRLVENISGFIADRMKEIHGGEWRVDVDHEVGFVVIRKRVDRNSDRVLAPKRGEVV